MSNRKKLIRITTVPVSLDKLLSGQLGFMNQFYDVVGISSDQDYLKIVGEKEGIRVWNLEMTRQITPIKDIAAVIKLYRFLKEEKPEIVHTHTPKAGIVGMLASKVAGVPHRFHTVAGLPLLEATGLKRKILNFVEKATYSCATKVYPNSFEMQRIIIELNLAKTGKLKVLGNGSSNGIDTSYFSKSHFSTDILTDYRSKLGITASDFVYVFVGRMVKDKGLNEMVKAFAQINANHPNVKLLLVGDYENELDPLLPDTLAEIKSNPNILEAGFQKDVRPYFALSNALVFPSYREGFPNVVMQAASLELPCIVSNINGCNEIISHQNNGIIIPVKDTEKLKSAMELILTDSDLYQQLKNNSRASITSRFEQKILWEAIKEEYDSLN